MKENTSPQKYNRDITDRILYRIDKGASSLEACRAENIDPLIFDKWVEESPELQKEIDGIIYLRRMIFSTRLARIINEIQEAEQDKVNGKIRIQALKLEADILKFFIESRAVHSCRRYTEEIKA